MFRGNAPASVDAKGRLKVPSAFRTPLETTYGRALFLTSVAGDNVRIYPMPVWLEIEQKLGAMPTTHPSKLRFLSFINYYGHAADLDAQGRVLIPQRLRDAATMTGEVDVLGHFNYLEVWNHDRFLTKMQREPYTDDDARALSEFGV